MRIYSGIILIISILLTGCGHKTPVGPVCVSCKPYYCRGSWHKPQTFYEYDEVGLASWYGGDFHGRSKATGEKFNKMAMTAAHKTLPLPAVVKVTNIRTGKSAVVVVDDRGPFCYKGRIIDLSYGAAKALDLHRYKPSPVRVQTLVEDSLKLSVYISRYCKHRRDPFGRTWEQLYFQEIKGVKFKMYTCEPNTKASRITPKQALRQESKHCKRLSTRKQNKQQKLSKKKYNSLGRYLNKI